MKRITKVVPMADYRLGLTYSDGVQGVVDLSDIPRRGVFAVWNTPSVFGSVTIGSAGELLWGDSIDLCPDSLYLRLTHKAADELFPALRADPIHA
jgi:hypothetical protein